MAFLIQVLCVCIVAGVCQALYTRYSSGLSRIPGPLLASFSNIWKVIAVYKENTHIRHTGLHEKYGPVVRIGPKHVSFSSTNALHTIHTSRTAFAKSEFYKGTTAPVYEGEPLENLFSLRDVEYHNRLKRNIGILYTRVAIANFEHHVNNCAKIMGDRMAARIPAGRGAFERFNMSLWLHFYAFDSLCAINVNESFGCLDKGEDVGGMLAFGDDTMLFFGLMSQAPILFQINRFFMWMKGVNTPQNPLFKYTIDKVHERLEKPNDNVDMLNAFIQARKERPDKVSVREIVGAIYINIMAGHDVLAISLRSIFYHLAKYPETQEILREELMTVANGQPDSEPLPSAKLLKLRYLEAVILEAARIHPNTSLILERTVPPGGAVIDGYELPAETIVGCNAWVIHRNPAVFGKDLNSFKPERWLEASEEQLAEMKRHIFSFGAGNRLCVGYNMAWLQMTKVVGEFFRRFECTLSEPDKEWKIHGSWVAKQTGMDMNVRRLADRNY